MRLILCIPCKHPPSERQSEAASHLLITFAAAGSGGPFKTPVPRTLHHSMASTSSRPGTSSGLRPTTTSTHPSRNPADGGSAAEATLDLDLATLGSTSWGGSGGVGPSAEALSRQGTVSPISPPSFTQIIRVRPRQEGAAALHRSQVSGLAHTNMHSMFDSLY